MHDGCKSEAHAAALVASELRYKKRPRVFFECADIVEFESTIYTTTVTLGGIPVSASLPTV